MREFLRGRLSIPDSIPPIGQAGIDRIFVKQGSAREEGQRMQEMQPPDLRVNLDSSLSAGATRYDGNAAIFAALLSCSCLQEGREYVPAPSFVRRFRKSCFSQRNVRAP